MPQVTKAVIAVAGWSTRFLPAVKAYAKHLVPVLDKPQVQYIVEDLVHIGVTDICFVHRHGEKTIRQHFTPDPVLHDFLVKNNKLERLSGLQTIIQKCRFRFIPQPRHLPYGNGTPILAAKNFIGRDPFFYFYGDDLIIEDQRRAYLQEMQRTFEKYHPAAISACQKVTAAEIPRLSSVKYRSTDIPFQMETVIEKPAPGTEPSLIAQVSPFLLTPQIITTLQTTAVARGELWLTDAINTMAHQDVVIGLPITHGHWATTGDPLNWLKVNIELALKNPQYSDELKKFFQTLAS